MSYQILGLTISRDQCCCVWHHKFAYYTHFNIKLHDSHEYTNLSKLEHNSIILLHRN